MSLDGCRTCADAWSEYCHRLNDASTVVGLVSLAYAEWKRVQAQHEQHETTPDEPEEVA